MAENTFVIKAGYMTGYSSVIFNSVDAIINSWFVSNFPKDYFKSISIESTNPGVLSRNDSLSKDEGSQRPKLRANYTIDADEDNSSIARPETERAALLTAKNRSFYPVLFKDKNDIQLSLSYGRTTINFEIEMTVESYGKQLDLLGYLKKTFLFKTPFFLSDFFYEFPIPSNLIVMMSTVLDIDLDSLSGVKKFLAHLNTNSLFPIILQRNPMNGKKTFFYRIKKDRLMMRIADHPSTDTGNILGRIRNDFKVNISMQAEIQTIEQFILFLPSYINGTEFAVEPNTLEQDDESVNRNYAMQTSFPPEIQTGSVEGVYRFDHSILKVKQASEAYEGIILNDLLNEDELNVYKAIARKSNAHASNFHRVLGVGGYKSIVGSVLKVIFDEDSGSLAIVMKDGSMFDHNTIYTFALYTNTFLLNMYKHYRLEENK